jgi:hypothetical protein
MIYFAHAMTDYNSPREQQALNLLAEQFSNVKVLNPNSPEHAAAAVAFKRAGMNTMDYFCALVRECSRVAFLPTPDGKIGPGVMKEMVEAHIFGKALHEIDLPGRIVHPFSSAFDRVLTIADLRGRLGRS